MLITPARSENMPPSAAKISGVASLMVDAVTSRDMPLLQACAMVFCSAYLLLVLIADVVAILANPRLRR